MLTLPGKLRGRSAGELRERGAQLARTWLERARLADAGECSDQELLERATQPDGTGRFRSFDEWLLAFRTRRPGLVAGFDDPDLTLRVLRATAPDRETAVIARADRILAGRFDLLGYRDLTFGDPIDWHLDPVQRKRAPLRHWSRIDYLDAQAVGDHKLLWELSRHQFVFSLGPAYWYSGDERYAEGFVALLTSWMHANPPKVGIHWASSLEVSFRAMSWLWGLAFFRRSPRLSPAFFGRVLKFLDVHARHIERYLSTYFSPNTHLTGEALGLLLLGTQLPELAGASRWRETGWRVLAEWLPRHTRSDGVYVEQATHYQRYTIDFFLLALIAGERAGLPARAAFAEPLQRLIDHFLYLQRPGGTIPHNGDEDGGSLLALDGLARDDARPLFALGACLFGRGDLAFVAGGVLPSTVWLLGPTAAAQLRQVSAEPPAGTSRGFPEGGVFVMRDRWSHDGDVLSVDCGPHGFANGGHAHADALAIELTVAGQPLFVDAGTYTYTGSAELRDRYRSSLVHNTVSVDGESSSVSRGPFAWRHVARSRLIAWECGERVDWFEGEHDGYARLADPVAVRRAILFAKGDYWIVRDVLLANGSHDVCLVFQCAPGISVEAVTDSLLEFRHADQPLLRMSMLGPRDAVVLEGGRVSRVYGSADDAPRCRWTAGIRGHAAFTSVLMRARAAGDWPEVRLEPHESGEALVIETADWRDTIVWGAPKELRDGVRCGDQVTWVRAASAARETGPERNGLPTGRGV